MASFFVAPDDATNGLAAAAATEQRDAKAVAELQPETLHFTRETEFLGLPSKKKLFYTFIKPRRNGLIADGSERGVRTMSCHIRGGDRPIFDAEEHIVRFKIIN